MGHSVVDIVGYRQLSDDEQATVNMLKELSSLVGERVEQFRNAPELDQRWIAIGATHLQQGFMALTRGITQPTTFG